MDRRWDPLHQANRQLDTKHVRLTEVSRDWPAALLTGEPAKTMRETGKPGRREFGSASVKIG